MFGPQFIRIGEGTIINLAHVIQVQAADNPIQCVIRMAEGHAVRLEGGEANQFLGWLIARLTPVHIQADGVREPEQPSALSLPGPVPPEVYAALKGRP